MKIAVIGATGMVGSALTEELLNRGHEVTGISRHPPPARERLTPRVADVMKVDELAAAIGDHDVVISAHSPGASLGPAVYKAVVEAGWRIKRAFTQAQGRYLITVGGASSLWAPGGTQMFEDERWPWWYFNSATPEHLRYLHGMTHADMFEQLAQSRERILATPGLDPQSDWPEQSAREFIQKIASNHDKGEGGRAQLEFFRNDKTLRWSFASPPWFMRPGPRMGSYRITIDTLPLEGERPAAISVADMALAVAEEAEAQKLVHQHWSAARIADG
ncbi:MAG TPA: NAD(P)H-binding protein [Steroidobacteraceae bacterium]|nr:NAD(P)H-binding protein [Steroidobacteraceae bacterium]